MITVGFGAMFTGRIIITFIIAGLWWSIADTATILAASDAYLGNEVIPARVLGQALSMWPRILGARILKGFWLMLGYICLFFPVFYVAARYFAVIPAVMIERSSVGDAFRRSSELSKDAKWRILGALALAFILYIIVGATLSAIVGLFPIPTIATALLSAMAYVLVFPLVGIVTTLLYYDLRIRKEGYDLELLAKRLEGEAGVGAPQPGTAL
jgi:hypothetical protein